ncbi:30S ribosomal protein S16 [Enterobacteriaceae endosymbiont of Plateumaris braccata]|uniref:30S ribosomal protein S16 n=1 Tax=Enterobacteriaceae endosymbiont of Plateumaris braccata TaxID=2675793 RepID=UPI00144A0AE6|nr:30S ribosomal protein S16 [Enterobacteriaceae endosymbiont of Plateumaris braccata]QJC28361.1 30S ribosomal protein S16 [Enterobacteriaceae endosymbiont of Plateumaris braccata]
MIKIRLSRHGVKKKPFYQIVVTNSKSPRDGRFIERIGYFNPFYSKKANNIKINKDKINFWLSKGAIISKRVNFLIKHNN